MKMTPLDIQQQTFKVSLRGFDRVEVTDFLESLRRDYEALMQENVALRERVHGLEADVERLRDHEVELQSCIVTARKMADEVVEQARTEADLISKEAEVTSTQLIQAAEDKASALRLSADEKASAITLAAQDHASSLRRTAQEEVSASRRMVEDQTTNLKIELTELRRQRSILRAELRSVLEAHLRMLDSGDHRELEGPEHGNGNGSARITLPRTPSANGMSKGAGNGLG